MNFLLNSLQSVFSSIGPFFILLGLLIFVHELGHFLVAKFFNVRVEVFSLGFGKKIFQFVRGETTYCISLVPLGGYVKMYGDDPTMNVPEDQKNRSFLHKPVGQRIAIVLAGPLMNFFFAMFLFFVIAQVGDSLPGGQIGDVAVDTQAYKDGFRSGDTILAINDKPMKLWSEIKNYIEDSPNQALRFDIKRGEETLHISAQPQLVNNDVVLSSKGKVGRIQGLTIDAQSALIGIEDPKSPAYEAGLRTLDLVEKVNGRDVLYMRDLQNVIREELQKSRQLKIETRSYATDKNPPPRTIDLNIAESIKADSPQLLADLGIEPANLYLLRVKKDSPAQKAGLKQGDKLIAIGGEPLTAWQQVIDTVTKFKVGQEPMKLVVMRDNEKHEIVVAPEMTELMNMQGQEEQRLTIGIVPAYITTTPPPILYKADSVGQALKIGWLKSVEWTELVVMSLVRLLQAEVSAKNIGGVITIGKFASQSFEVGLSAFLKMMAIISINLFLLNLLPVPVLDGGHLVFFTIEALRGAPLSLRKMEIAQQVGMIILISLMAFALFNDISNLFRAPW